MPYTPQQELAINTRDVSIALAAGAGCGKTFVLTQRFVSELLLKPAPETLSGMMAITFTDRAAREMRDRIRETVRHQLAQCSAEELPRWQEILQGLESARIQTIHAFCASTLRAYSTELGLDPDFIILDEPTAISLRNEVIQSELTRLLRSRNAALSELVLRFGLEGVINRLQSLMKQRFQLPDVLQKFTDSEQLIEHWKTYHREQFLPARLFELSQLPSSRLLFETLREHDSTSPRMQERRQLILIHLETLLRTNWLQKEEVQELREQATVQHVRAQHWDNAEIHETVKNCCKILRDEIDDLLPLYELDETALELSAQFGMQALELINEVSQAYETLKQAQSALDFDDLLLMLRKLVLENDTVRKQLQGSINFLLLDEFQDTDPVQTQIVQALCGDQLTTGGLFLVGDVKQSIYRFRRADPEVFRQLRRQIPDKGQLSLTKNFRSQQEVLDFVNFLFAPAMPGEYDALSAFDQGPYPPEEKIEFLLATHDGEDALKADESRRLEASWIASRIAELLSDSTPRIRKKNRQTGEVELRTVQPGDIVILFRAFSNLGLYEEALRQLGIEYYVVGGRAFFAQQEIYDLVNLCRYLDDQTDEAALTGVLRSPLFGWSDDLLLLLTRACEGLGNSITSTAIPENLPREELQPVNSARRILNRLLELRLETGIGDLLRMAVEQTAFDAALMTEFLGERKVANLHKLLDMADQFDRVGLLGLSEFADRLLDMVAEEANEELAATHPETGNVVRLMTVHQSKGLEFPVVVVADVNRKQNAGTESVVLSTSLGPLVSLPKIRGEERANPALAMFRDREKQADEAEAIRLFYVAATRAADYLILSGCLPEENASSGPWMKLLQERFDLQTGLPAGDPWLGQAQQPGEDWRRIPRIRVVSEKPTGKADTGRERSLKLAVWEQALAESVPTPPEPMALPLQPDLSSRARFTVSELEEIETLLRAPESTPAANYRHRANPASGNSLQEAERLGNLLHLAMEQFDPQHPPSPQEFIDQISLTVNEHYSEDLKQNAARRFAKILQADWLEELKASSKLLRETEFLLRWTSDEIGQPAVIVGTIDCLLQDQQGNWHLIDYKTGLVPDSAAEAERKFGLQLTLYALAIREFTGQWPASIRLVQLSETPRTVQLRLEEKTIFHYQQAINKSIHWLRSNTLAEN